jgi:P27 family predicted phage terminase small subunit
MPLAPDELSKEALTEWKRLEPFLVGLNRVAEIDAEPLYAYCTYWGRFASLMANHFADESASLTADGPTCEVIHPLLPELIGYAREMMSIAAEFGLTARSRDLDGNDPRKIPAAVKRFYGNRRKVADSKLPDSVIPMLPDWDERDLEPPMWINARAATIYRSLGSQLRNLDLFTPIDKIHICTLACLGDLFRRANEQLKNDFVPVFSKRENEDGELSVMYEKAHPLHKAIKELGKIAKEYWTAYGMSPRARKIFDGEQPAEKKERPLVFKGKFG